MEFLDNELAKIDAILEPIGNGVGFPIDQFKFILCLLASFPLAIIHKAFSNVVLRHAYAIVVGLIFGWLLYGSALYHSFLSSTILYLMVRAIPSSPLLPTLAFVFSMGYMTVNHIYRQYYDYLGWKLDFTASQMIVTLKLIAFAFDISDKKQKDPKYSIPSPLEFYSYIYYFVNFLAGPFFEFDEYISFIDLSLFKKTKGKIPFSWSSFGKSFVGIGISLLGIVIRPMFPATRLLEDDFLNVPMIERFLYIYICYFGVRCNYYACWTISEAVSIVSGFGYRETPEGEVKWDRMKNMDVVKWETAQNLYTITAVWNIRVAGWLRKYVYERLARGKKPGTREQYATFAVSAFWHGFYPGYYLFFLWWPLFTQIAAGCRRSIRTFFLTKDGKEKYPAKYFYDVFSWVMTVLAANYLAISFQSLAFDRSWRLYKSFYFAGHIICLLLWTFVKLDLLPKKKIDAPAPVKKTN